MNNLVCQKFKIEKKTTTFGILIITSAVIWLLELIPILGSIVRFVLVVIGVGLLVNYILPSSEKSNKKAKKTEKENKK